MKKTLCLIIGIAVALIINNSAYSQTIPKQNIVTTNPFGLVVGIINAKYEKLVSKKNSWGVEALLWNYDSASWKWTAYGGGVIYKTFLKPEVAPAGMWWSVAGEILMMDIKYIHTEYIYDPYWGFYPVTKEDTATATVVAPVASLGYSWLLGAQKNFIISVGGSAGYGIGTVEIAGEKMPYGGLSLGILIEIGLLW